MSGFPGHGAFVRAAVFVDQRPARHIARLRLDLPTVDVPRRRELNLAVFWKRDTQTRNVIVLSFDTSPAEEPLPSTPLCQQPVWTCPTVAYVSRPRPCPTPSLNRPSYTSGTHINHVASWSNEATRTSIRPGHAAVPSRDAIDELAPVLVEGQVFARCRVDGHLLREDAVPHDPAVEEHAVVLIAIGKFDLAASVLAVVLPFPIIPNTGLLVEHLPLAVH